MGNLYSRVYIYIYTVFAVLAVLYEKYNFIYRVRSACTPREDNQLTTVKMAQYQRMIITTNEDKPQAKTRRLVYIRPFIVFWAFSVIAEIVFLLAGILVFSGLRDITHKILWTLVFCPLGMGGAMGGITDVFLVDHYYGRKAVWFTAVLSLFVLGSCNYLCFSLDHHFGWFGAEDHPLWFHWRYPAIFGAGWAAGDLLFTDAGQRRLAAFGI